MKMYNLSLKIHIPLKCPKFFSKYTAASLPRYYRFSIGTELKEYKI